MQHESALELITERHFCYVNQVELCDSPKCVWSNVMRFFQFPGIPDRWKIRFARMQKEIALLWCTFRKHQYTYAFPLWFAITLLWACFDFSIYRHQHMEMYRYLRQVNHSAGRKTHFQEGQCVCVSERKQICLPYADTFNFAMLMFRPRSAANKNNVRRRRGRSISNFISAYAKEGEKRSHGGCFKFSE